MRQRKIPSYRLHKPSGQAVVTLNRRDVYLGTHGSPESRAEYDRVVKEWLPAGRQSVPAKDEPEPGPTVVEVLAAFWKHAQVHYQDVDGSHSSELKNMRHALRPLRLMYGETVATDFGPLALRALREEMVR